MLFELETAAGSWRATLVTTLEVFFLTCLQAVLAVGVYETLQGRRPAARALVQSGLGPIPGTSHEASQRTPDQAIATRQSLGKDTCPR